MAKSVVRKKATKLTYPSVEVLVGILDGDKRYAPDEGAEEGELPSIGEVAEKHEFGLGVPQRSWLRGWFDEQADDVKKHAEDWFHRAANGTVTWEQALTAIESFAEGGIRKRISDGQKLTPITNPKTIALKKAKGKHPPYTPLIETGFLYESVVAAGEVKP